MVEEGSRNKEEVPKGETQEAESTMVKSETVKQEEGKAQTAEEKLSAVELANMKVNTCLFIDHRLLKNFLSTKFEASWAVFFSFRRCGRPTVRLICAKQYAMKGGKLFIIEITKTLFLQIFGHAVFIKQKV